MISNKTETKYHYTAVNDLSRLLKRQIDPENKNHRKLYFCHNCLNYKTTPEALKNHEKWCLAHEANNTVMPKKGDKVEFKNFKHKTKLPGIMYCDFEATLKKVDREKLKGNVNINGKSINLNYSKALLQSASNMHVPNSWKLYGTRIDGEIINRTYIDIY